MRPERLLRVWHWNGEDPMDELQRRFAAAAKHHGLKLDDIGDRLFVDSGRTMPIVIAEQTVRRDTRIAEPVIKEVIAALRDNQIDILMIDPFVSCHRVSENDNAAIESVAKSWSHVAEAANCSIMLAHHTRKTGGEGVTVDDGRGASALLAAARTARTLNTMTVKEAEDAEIDERERRSYFRADIGKANLTRPAEQADWFKLVSVDLENPGPDADWDAGDSVGVVTAWEYPQVDQPVVNAADIRRAQDAIRAGGPWRADQRSKNEPWVGAPVARALGLPDLLSKNEKRAVAKVVDEWLRAGLLKRVEGRDGHRDAHAYIEAGNEPVVPASGAPGSRGGSDD